MKPNPAIPTWSYLAALLLCLGIFCLPQATWAQQAEMSIGLASGVSNQPEEKDFDRTAQTLDLSFDWQALRVGYNSATSYMDYNLYEVDWAVQLATTSWYGAWRWDLTEKGGFYTLLGITYQTFVLSLGSGVGDQNSQAYGLVYGTGMQYDLDGLIFGMQWMSFKVPSTGTKKVVDIELATGSNQLQLAARIPF
ncbi:MAG: hypothetical protein RRB13_03790 [bacterium]|nr:hypothetical protein [bacterium]